MADIPLTQRAYTLRLRGVNKNDNSWRERLWQTHVAVNKGAKAFGDWLLTLRGGLSHEIVDMKVSENSEHKPNINEKHRRIFLALSWLSVESKKGAPENFIVPCDTDVQTGRRTWKTVDTFKEILKCRGLNDNEIKQWIEDCSTSLSSAIRDDAVWVNRSKAFDNINNNNLFTQEDIWDFLNPFFSNKETYLRPIKEESEKSVESEGMEENEKDLVQKAGQWLSSRFGKGKGADFSRMKTIYETIHSWASIAIPGQNGQDAIVSLAKALDNNTVAKDLQGVLALISGPGYKSATRNLLKKINDNTSISKSDLNKLKDLSNKDSQNCANKSGNKGKRSYADKILKDVEASCGFTYCQENGAARHSKFAVMLDHAARRVSLVHTWIKRSESERRKFEEDARKISAVPQSAKEWLDTFCEKRSGASNAIEDYRIRKRAVDGWKEIVKVWSKADCRTEEDRIHAVRELQDNPEIDKFGDIQLFEALAVDDAKCVWYKKGDPKEEPDPQPLLDYVAATDAETKKRRFKVPAYRHPDPLLHPIFCDFGNSRWNIKFDIHEYMNTSRKKQNLNIYGLKMGLLDGRNVTDTELQWSSKLLTSDLALMQKADTNSERVSRASRLGRAVKNITRDLPVSIEGLFEQKDWNGRLQVPREQLKKIAWLEEKLPNKADTMRSKIKWLITFSPRLQPQGPWLEHISNSIDKSPFERTYQSGAKKWQKYVSFSGWPMEVENKNRESKSRLILSRLPGLRVLSVDLGHRYAAACVVWETLTGQKFEEECKKAKGEGAKVIVDDLYAMIQHTEKESNAVTKKAQEENRIKKFRPTTFYRRIGPDILNDNESHPAPWARLDRQFIIKLQGEEEDARKASTAEIEAFRKLEQELGHEPSEEQSLQVDEVMSEAVRLARLGLKRHADRARIAHYFITNKKVKPGGVEENLDNNGRIEILTDGLEIWYELFNGSRWTDGWAKEKWGKHIKPIVSEADLPTPVPDEELLTSKELKQRKEDLRGKLKGVVEKLAKQDNMKLHCFWATRWREDETNWRKHLRWLRDWILPKGKRADNPAIRHIGGLSLTRIATIKSLYQIQKAYFQRFTPDGRQIKEGKPITTGEGFGEKILNAMENMRDQRVKQLASRIIEAALGVGRVKIPKGGKDPKRPFKRVDASCHAIVIENLTYYRPEETRTRRENRQLMSWSSSKVKKYLSESCQLHGLHLREVQAGYTSRQDSRTGAPGIRCEDISLKKFLDSSFWKKENKSAKGKEDERSKYLIALFENFSNMTDYEKKKTYLRIPLKGGNIFVSSDKNSPASKGIQADLNAAANIGLKALLDPDWTGRWWYVPCDSKGFSPLREKIGGSAAIDVNKPLKTTIQEDIPEDPASEKDKKKHNKKSESKSNNIINLWHDLSSSPLNNRQWQEYPTYWNQVQSKVIRILRKQIGVDNKS